VVWVLERCCGFGTTGGIGVLGSASLLRSRTRDCCWVWDLSTPLPLPRPPRKLWDVGSASKLLRPTFSSSFLFILTSLVLYRFSLISKRCDYWSAPLPSFHKVIKDLIDIRSTFFFNILYTPLLLRNKSCNLFVILVTWLHGPNINNNNKSLRGLWVTRMSQKWAWSTTWLKGTNVPKADSSHVSEINYFRWSHFNNGKNYSFGFQIEKLTTDLSYRMPQYKDYVSKKGKALSL
jgi:hypothetical protein